MSYCHLKNGIGINFVKGFGPLPQAVIRNNISASDCLTTRNIWTGTISSAWENSANWSCGSLPDDKTDVIIRAGLLNYPVIKSSATCRSITQMTNTSVMVNSTFKLRIAGTSVK